MANMQYFNQYIHVHMLHLTVIYQNWWEETVLEDGYPRIEFAKVRMNVVFEGVEGWGGLALSGIHC
jgi:hypothetical protein